tara:strand:- start:495 stop:1169 length:675 start_codon:yes stop_codon:yes gene_type:complete
LIPKIITIDGPSGVGKGTIAVMIADHFGFNYLDSGSLYRSLALALSEENIDIDKDLVNSEKILSKINIDYRHHNNGDIKIFVNNKEYTNKIRTEHVAKMASEVAKNPSARRILEIIQRNHIKFPGLVADGRDMGTKVFTEASNKFFLTASLEKRAERRLNQLKNQGISANLPDLIQELLLRDKADSERAISPLVPAKDAVIVDTTDLNVSEVFTKIIMEVDKEI